MTQNFHNLTDKERDELNLPPEGFQGEEFTTIIQAPTSTALQKNIEQFRVFAKAKQYETFEILQQGRDPDGGFKAIVVAHNWNPITWAAEKAHRAYLGAKHGIAVGKEKAEIKHVVGVKAELGRAAEEEEALARRRLAIGRAVEAEKLIGDPEVAAARQRAKYARLLAPATKPTPATEPAPATRPAEVELEDLFADLNASIFGRGASI